MKKFLVKTRIVSAMVMALLMLVMLTGNANAATTEKAELHQVIGKEYARALLNKVEAKTDNKEIHLMDFSKAVKTHYFYPDTYLKVKSDDKLGHIKESEDRPEELKGKALVKFYTDKVYTLTTSKGTYKMYKVEMKGKTGYINANFLNEKFYVKLYVIYR